MPWTALAVTQAAASNGFFEILAALPFISAVDPAGYTMVDRLLVPLICSVVAGLASALIAIAVLRVRIKTVEDQTKVLGTNFHAQSLLISEQANDRAQCELRAAQSYCTRAELVRMTVDMGHESRMLSEKVDEGFKAVYQCVRDEVGKVHERVNLLAPEARKD